MFSIMYLFNHRETFAEVFFGLRLNNSDPSITAGTAVHLMNFLTRWVRFDTPDLNWKTSSSSALTCPLSLLPA